jgi:hypothetical protein
LATGDKVEIKPVVKKKFHEFYDKQMFNARLLESVKIVTGWASIFHGSICNELSL